MSEQHDLRGKTVLVAGGAKNLGGLIARDFAAHGAGAVAVHYNSASSRAEAEATVETVRKAGARAAAFQGDLTLAANATTIVYAVGSLGGGSFTPLVQVLPAS